MEKLFIAKGKGTIYVHTSKGPKYIHHVLLIPNLSQNLLSVAQLLKKGYSISFKNNGCVIIDSTFLKLCRLKCAKIAFH